MKKLLILAIAVCSTMMFTGCSDSEPTYTSFYVYKNNSSRDITIVSYFPPNDFFQEIPEATFTILIGDSHRLRFDADGDYPYPFWGQSLRSADSVIVSNGEMQFVNTKYSEWGEDKLFRKESYEIIKDDDEQNNRTYRYVFTDKDFENGTPVK